MFICSVKASTVRFAGLILLSVAMLVGVLVYAGADTAEVAGYTYNKVKTDEDRINFLSQFGWKTTGVLVEQETFTIPNTFDRVLLGYNEIQKSQGLDLARYENKKVTRYTYEISNYESYSGTVYANIIMYRDKVIAADICSADPMGFVQGLERANTPKG